MSLPHPGHGSTRQVFTQGHWALWTVMLLLALSIQFPAWARGEASRSRQIGELKALQTIDQRVADIAWRLLARGTDLCPNHGASLGIALHDLVQYRPGSRRDAVVAFGFVGRYPSILTVAKQSPAEKSGVLVNDVLVAVNGVRLPSDGPTTSAGGTEQATYGSVDLAMRTLESLPAGSPAALTLLRHGTEITVEILPDKICHSRIELVPGSQINANANGDVAQVYGGLVAWVGSDDELAFVIAHEVAHNILGHQGRIDKERLKSGLFAGLGDKGHKLRDMERDADRLGTWLAAKAGYNYKLAPSFWESLTMRSGLGAVWATTHPTASNRRQNLENTVQEIELALDSRPTSER